MGSFAPSLKTEMVVLSEFEAIRSGAASAGAQKDEDAKVPRRTVAMRDADCFMIMA